MVCTPKVDDQLVFKWRLLFSVLHSVVGFQREAPNPCDGTIWVCGALSMWPCGDPVLVGQVGSGPGLRTPSREMDQVYVTVMSHLATVMHRCT